MSYSNHNYIEFNMGGNERVWKAAARGRPGRLISPRWVYKNLDGELFDEVVR